MYGTPATTSNVLKATSSVAGSFVYSPTNGSILSPGTNQVVATFTPTDTNNYLSGTITNIVSVMPAFFFTNGATTNWICPPNVTSVQVECWGAGGAGGSAYRPGGGNAWGGGGAGGAYAKRTNVTVVPGYSYTINVGAGGVSSTNNLATVPGGDSWFANGSLTNCLANGGAGGVSLVSSGNAVGGAGGTGSSAGSLGDVVYAGGNGASGASSFGGGGGSSAGTASAGTTATSYLGASAVTGGGAGGNGKDSSPGDGLSGASPGGGGGGARATTAGGAQTFGGPGGAGQVIVSVKTITANLTLGGLAQNYDGNPKSATVITDPANLNTVVTYNGSSNLPTAGGSYAVVATINENNYSGTNSGTLVIAKVSQTITFGLDSATGKVGDAARTLIAESSSGLPVTLISSNTNVATITGAEGNTLNFVGTGTTTITAKQAGNSNYEAATDVEVVLTVTASDGLTFGQAFGGLNPTNVDTDGLAYLMKYALGGTNTNDKVSLPTVSLNGSNVTLTAVVRTNDTNLTIIGQSTTNLAGTWSNIPANPYGIASSNTNNVPTGCQRKDFSVQKGTNSRLFLRLKASQ